MAFGIMLLSGTNEEEVTQDGGGCGRFAQYPVRVPSLLLHLASRCCLR